MGGSPVADQNTGELRSRSGQVATDDYDSSHSSCSSTVESSADSGGPAKASEHVTSHRDVLTMGSRALPELPIGKMRASNCSTAAVELAGLDGAARQLQDLLVLLNDANSSS